MFLGHYAVAFASKKLAPKASLGTLVLSAQLVDLLWPIFLLLGLEHVRIVAGSTRVGLGLWNSFAGTVLVEGALFAVGVAMYLRSTAARDRLGSYGFASLASFLTMLNVASLLGPPPPSVAVLALVSLGGWMFVPWAWWADRHRQPLAN